MSEENIFNLDLDSVEQLTDRSAVKPGPQTLTITDAEGGESAKKKTPYIRIQHTFANPDGLQAIEAGMEPRLTVKHDFYLSQKALPFLRRFVEALGMSWDEFKPTLQAVLAPLASKDIAGFQQQVKDVFAGAVQGRSVEAVIGIENGFNNVGRYVITQPTA